MFCKLAKLMIVSFLVCVYLSISCEAAPVITDYNNSVSGTTLFPHQQINTNIQFNVTNDTACNFTWIKDGVTISNNWDNYTTSWTRPGNKNITAYCTDGGGDSSNIITWNPIIEQEMAGAGDVIAEINTSAYDDIIEVIGAEDPNYESFLYALAVPHINIIGSLIFVFLYGVPFLFIWLGQGSAKIPAILACILSPVLLGAFNPDYIAISILLILLTIVGVLYTIYKQRGS